jgi:hypothetical protein
MDNDLSKAVKKTALFVALSIRRESTDSRFPLMLSKSTYDRSEH